MCTFCKPNRPPAHPARAPAGHADEPRRDEHARGELRGPQALRGGRLWRAVCARQPGPLAATRAAIGSVGPGFWGCVEGAFGELSARASQARSRPRSGDRVLGRGLGAAWRAPLASCPRASARARSARGRSRGDRAFLSRLWGCVEGTFGELSARASQARSRRSRGDRVLGRGLGAAWKAPLASCPRAPARPARGRSRGNRVCGSRVWGCVMGKAPARARFHPVEDRKRPNPAAGCACGPPAHCLGHAAGCD